MKWTKRELQEIYHALHYAETTAHGTVGHNPFMVIAKLAGLYGFSLLPKDGYLSLYYKNTYLGGMSYWPDEEIEL